MDTNDNTSSLPGNLTAAHIHRWPDIYLALFVVEILICFVGLTGNSLTCLAILGNKRLHVATNFYVLSLAIADLLVTGFLVPVRAAEHLASYRGTTKPHVTVMAAAIFIGRATILASFANLAALSIDRFLALKFPIRYRVSFRHSTRLTLSVIITIWTVSVVLTTVPKYKGVTPLHGLILFVIFVVIMTIIICVANWQVFKLVKELSLRLQWYRKMRGKTTDALIKSIHTDELSILNESNTRDSEEISHHNLPGSIVNKRGSGIRRFLSDKSRKSLLGKTKNCDLETSSNKYCNPHSRSVSSGRSEYLKGSKLLSGQISTDGVGPLSVKGANLTKHADIHNYPGTETDIKCTTEKEKAVEINHRVTKCPIKRLNKNSSLKSTKVGTIMSCISCRNLREKKAIANGQREKISEMPFRERFTQNGDHSLPIDRNTENGHSKNNEADSEQKAVVKRKIGVYKRCDLFEYHASMVGHTGTGKPSSGTLERKDSPAILVTNYDSKIQGGELEESETYDYKKAGQNIKEHIEVEDDNHAESSCEDLRSPKVSFSSTSSVSTYTNPKHSIREGDAQHANSRIYARIARKLKYPRTNLNRKYTTTAVTRQRFRRKKSPGLPTAEQLSDRLVAQTLALVIGLFVLLVYPRICLILYHVWRGEDASSQTARLWLKVLLYTNSILNPFLYAWRLHDFRCEFQRIFNKCYGCIIVS